MSDCTMRVWYKSAVQDGNNPDKPEMYHMKEFKKGEETHLAEWILRNRDQLSETIITDGSKQIKYVLEAR